jgi:O-antigen ligase
MIALAYAALWVFVFVLPWEGVIVLPGLAIVSRVTGMIAAVVALLAVVLTGRIRRWHPFHISALLFVGVAGFELIAYHGTQGDKLPSKYFTYVQLFIVLLMIWELAPSWRRMLGLLMAYVFGAYVAALDTIWLYRHHTGSMLRFYVGSDPNDLAMTLALALPMAWYLGMTEERKLLRWACRGYMVVGLLAIGLTGSRGGMLTSIVALSLVPLSLNRLAPKTRAAAIVLIIVAGGLAALYVPDAIFQRLATTTTEVEDARLGGRFRLWVAGLKAYVYHPMLGYGTGSFKSVVASWLGSGAQVAHNSYISVLVEQGIIGLLIYLSMFLAVFRAVLHLPTLERRFSLVLMATLGIAITPLSWEDRKPVWFVLAALLGLAQAYRTAKRVVARQQGGVQRVVPAAARPTRPMEPTVFREGGAQGDVPA